MLCIFLETLYLKYRVFKVFDFLFDFFELTANKCSLVAAWNRESTALLEAEKARQQEQEVEWKATSTDIKNIDDPNTDEDEAKTQTSPEETDDFLLIGSWFDDQLNTDSATTPTDSAATNTNAAADSNVTSVTAAATDNRLAGADSSNATQLLDATFELEQSPAQNNGVRFLSFLLLLDWQLLTFVDF